MFVDYNTPAVRGWIFMAMDNAINRAEPIPEPPIPEPPTTEPPTPEPPTPEPPTPEPPTPTKPGKDPFADLIPGLLDPSDEET